MSFKFYKNIVNRIRQLGVYILNYLKKLCKDIAHWRWIIFINVSQKKNPCVSGQELSLLKSFQGKKSASFFIWTVLTTLLRAGRYWACLYFFCMTIGREILQIVIQLQPKLLNRGNDIVILVHSARFREAIFKKVFPNQLKLLRKK